MTTLPFQPVDILADIRAIAIEAGDRIMEVYESEFDVRSKDDHSPVTDADHAADIVILKSLQALTPRIPIVTEEQVDAGNIPDISGGVFWLVDPLDGTKEFIRRNGEFTVNIALIADRRPVLGVVHAPALDVTYQAAFPAPSTVERDGGLPEVIEARMPPRGGLTVVSSRSHANNEALSNFLTGVKVKQRMTAGSSLKFCMIAEGKADLYPRFGRTMEWDVAAAHAVLLGASGDVELFEGGPMIYGKPGFENPHFIARGQQD
ncbi:3'(2'),5'-bisphosphate nucleotidase CysQ [Alphaproteobacteria bacterium HT1-32]|nr:3'(2'),5'-bisphosphate nucleotidase CysQ [Alphaproteobacteria bacterium HT1-32]|tara:strand:- start:5795 stop:6580 length:786 start_codon:yes stop_codon:yes gene_type:complete